ncbi:hypothetical protein [Burkholderia sp. WSM2232]|uniref:hypothetical protein n=1 Tax=Burkholderia sp. WSM2232 TaxID=944436 RepID=UPI001E35A2E0|nr:hypothetical protein [Burkholderia sp. WSM2232]
MAMLDPVYRTHQPRDDTRGRVGQRCLNTFGILTFEFGRELREACTLLERVQRNDGSKQHQTHANGSGTQEHRVASQMIRQKRKQGVATCAVYLDEQRADRDRQQDGIAPASGEKAQPQKGRSRAIRSGAAIYNGCFIGRLPWHSGVCGHRRSPVAVGWSAHG